MKNALIEAAAELLSKSRESASKEEMPKQKAGVEGEAEDLGGQKPETGMDPNFPATKNIKKAVAPGNGDKSDGEHMTKIKEDADEKDKMPSFLKKDEKKDEKDEKDEDEKEDEETPKDEKDEEKKEDEKKKMKEDVDLILGSDTSLSEDFRTKVAAIYEARIQDKTKQIKEEVTLAHAVDLKEAVQELETRLVEKVDAFLSYVVEEWMQKNEVAIESGLRSELTEEFIAGLRNLFAEHYISVPEEKVDLVDELAGKVEVLEGELNESVARNIEMKKQLIEAQKTHIIETVCEGLAQTQTEKIRSLVESAEFTTDGDFQKRVETIRENYFPTTVKAVEPSTLNEVVDSPEIPVVAGSRMESYTKAISKTIAK